jgi:hypothetical protein
MTPEEHNRLVGDVKRAIYNELADTIPPSIDLMRGIRFEEAAKKAVELCLKRTNTEIS